MTTDEAMLHASNRAAHKVAKEARRYVEATPAGSSVSAYWDLRRAVRNYEEVERRASEAREATA